MANQLYSRFEIKKGSRLIRFPFFNVSNTSPHGMELFVLRNGQISLRPLSRMNKKCEKQREYKQTCIFYKHFLFS